MQFSKDTIYNATVTAARFDESARKWSVKTEDGSEYLCRWFIPAIGFAAKAYVPPIKGLDTFKGAIHHTAVRIPICSDISKLLANADMNSNGLKKVSISRASASLSLALALQGSKQSKNVGMTRST